MPSFDSIRSEAKAALQAATTTAELEQLRLIYLGRKGAITQALHTLGEMPADKRPAAGAELNQIKADIDQALAVRQAEMSRTETAAQVEAEQLDVTLDGRRLTPGSRHPTLRVMERICQWFVEAGFSEVYGPEIEDDYHNFEALNIPPLHPARAMHDTFYFSDGRLLRTHTSPVQIRTLKQQSPPVRVIAPGPVYRCDSDLTHSPMFHQVEGLCVEPEISFRDLKGVLLAFLEDFFNDHEIETRFRPSYFPFTEPSAEVDVRLRGGGWLEVMGCGMVHPQVLRSVDLDPEVYHGYAFGLGVERLTMLYYGIEDLRLLFSNDLHFLRQFHGNAS